jgi:hypothetical protein
MIAFGHTAVGAGVGVLAFSQLGSTLDPIAGLSLTTSIGVVSHYLTDSIPHGHFFKGISFSKKRIIPVIVFDLLISLLLFWELAYLNSGFSLKFLYIFAGILGAQLPDIVDGLIYIKVLPNKSILKKENDFHQFVHWHGREDETLIVGARDIWQVAVVLLGIWVVLRW